MAQAKKATFSSVFRSKFGVPFFKRGRVIWVKSSISAARTTRRFSVDRACRRQQHADENAWASSCPVAGASSASSLCGVPEARRWHLQRANGTRRRHGGAEWRRRGVVKRSQHRILDAVSIRRCTTVWRGRDSIISAGSISARRATALEAPARVLAVAPVQPR